MRVILKAVPEGVEVPSGFPAERCWLCGNRGVPRRCTEGTIYWCPQTCRDCLNRARGVQSVSYKLKHAMNTNDGDGARRILHDALLRRAYAVRAFQKERPHKYDPVSIEFAASVTLPPDEDDPPVQGQDQSSQEPARKRQGGYDVSRKDSLRALLERERALRAKYSDSESEDVTIKVSRADLVRVREGVSFFKFGEDVDLMTVVSAMRSSINGQHLVIDALLMAMQEVYDLIAQKEHEAAKAAIRSALLRFSRE